MPDVTPDFSFTNGTTADAAQLQDVIDEIVAAVNALTAENFAAGAITFEVGHTFAVAGEVRVPSGQVDVIPLLFVPVIAGQAVTLKRVRYKIAAGTSATFKVQKNGVDVTGLTGLAASAAAAEASPSSTTALADDDTLQVIVTAVAGTPQNMTITLVLEHANA